MTGNLFFKSMVEKIVITGAPASGKTDFLNRLKNDRNFTKFTFFDELARKLLDENPKYRSNWGQFHRDIYNLQTEREDNLEVKIFITDRGTVDAFAFHPETMIDIGTTLKTEYKRYDAVIQLGSAANLGEKYYRKDNIRLEKPDEALEIERKIKNIWKNHPNYVFIETEVDINNKYQNFYNKLINLMK